MQNRYKEMLNSLDNNKPEELNLNSRVLIIDSLNLFIRSFSVIRHLNKNLVPIGGLTGFLRSLGYISNLVRPTRIILVFDGLGASTNKRYLFPEYKANRHISRITNWDAFESQQDESDAITNQIVRLVSYLKCLPVDLVIIDKVEADDVIGYICNNIDGNITIASSDRDYLQLVSNKINVYSPIKKIFYNEDKILQEYGVTSLNFLTQKILLGDSGDNVPGVPKLGVKTLLKEFPELGAKELITIDDILNKCKKGNKKAYTNILNFKHQLNINKLLMDLSNPNIPEEDQITINETLNNPNKEFNPQEFLNLYDEDDLGDSIKNIQNWLFNTFHFVSQYK